MRGKPAAKNVDDYLAALPQALRPKLDQLRALIRAATPDVTEGISYGMPYYKHNGVLAGFALFKNHIGFFPGAIVAEFADELSRYEISKGTVRLPLDKPLPVTLIRKMLKRALERNREKAKKNSPARL
jgi:uncharacterized protein YdhG (YjbR/CyaY superfamily)